jgi:hypothetical protein
MNPLIPPTNNNKRLVVFIEKKIAKEDALNEEISRTDTCF